MKPHTSSKWLVPIGKHNQEPKLSLFCFPPAGAGTLFFRHWSSLVPHGVNLWAVRLPGRETRINEPLLTTWPELVEPLIQALNTHCHRPFALFGHSLGALMSFEIAHQLRKHLGYLPTALVVSGRQPPHLPVKNRDYKRTDVELLEELRLDGGTPEAVLQNSELMDLFLPIYRADLQLNQDYEYHLRETLPCPILALGGRDDQTVEIEALEQWQSYTCKRFQLQCFPGGHMYLSQQRELADLITTLSEFISRN